MMLDQIFSSQSEVVTHIANHVSAIGLTSMASYGVIRSTPDTAAVRILKIEVVDSTNKVQTYYPYQAYIYTEEYPLHLPVYLYFMPDRSELAAGFSAFIASAVGQKIILNYGLVPATMPVRLVQLNNEGVNPK
jgi:phosphate transport system substrate-binding protein